MKRLLFLTICLIGFSMFHAQTNSKTPLMGWASWNHFGVNISETIIKNQADAMVSSGLAAAGYNYLNIDDGFFYGRYPNGALRIDSIKFPNRMKYLADYIHSRGLKAGYYTDAGANTCGSQYNGQTGGVGGGLFNHDQQDIDTIFKSWGYDFLKVDYCGGLVQKLDEKARYTAIRTAMNHTGIPDIKYNVCRWQFPGSWITTVADSWRISTDIYLNWNSVIDIIDKNAFLAVYASPGHYNDMDMLEVGRGLTAEEDRSHFSMWCILSSPLVMGNDMTNITQTTKNILTNAEVIAVNQDTTGLQAKIVTDNGAGLQVWAKNLNGLFSKERAVVLLNRSATAASMSVKWKNLNLVGSATARNLWSHTDLGVVDSMYTVTVPSHGVVMLKVVGSETKLQEVFEAEYGWINNFNLTSNSVLVPDQGRASADATCSGRGKAGWLGFRADNYLEFRDVFANIEGSYKLTIIYISGESRSAILTVNGKDTLLTNLNSGGWTILKSFTYPVSLKKGYNTIRFSNATAWLPDFDKISLDLNKYGSSTGITNVTTQPINFHPNPCSSSLQIDNDEPIKQVEIYSLTGNLLSTHNQSKINTSGLKSGTYLVSVTTGQGTFSKKVIKE